MKRLYRFPHLPRGSVGVWKMDGVSTNGCFTLPSWLLLFRSVVCDAGGGGVPTAVSLLLLHEIPEVGVGKGQCMTDSRLRPYSQHPRTIRVRTRICEADSFFPSLLFTIYVLYMDRGFSITHSKHWCDRLHYRTL